jgi:replicative DNA helicase
VGLRAVAKESPKVALYQACQLNRECEKTPSKKPGMHHLRASGKIEEVSDVIALLYRPWRYFPDSKTYNPDELYVHFAKVREGETGTPLFCWNDGLGTVRGPMSRRGEE